MKDNKFLEKIKGNKLAIGGTILSIAGGVISLLSNRIEEKLLDKKIDDRFDAKIAEMIAEEDDKEN